ncbi:calcium-binding and coiled-coil domain-containing protein 1b isoform X2 [Esox lucius]|nr:calcium-binding and coiled-coil domain-containing protein 1b isoform X2 [Esox lucius]
MESQSKVEFRNVGQMYFPQSRVDCHFSLRADHHWTNKDWIGLFKADWSSVKEYSTFAWAVTPEGFSGGTNANCCVHFQASYLPRPSDVEYQFVYVDHQGQVCARSRNFTFCISKPLDELETLTEEKEQEEGDEEGDGDDLMLVVPRAQLLQTRLEECLRDQAVLKKAREEAEREKEREEEKSKRAKEEWEREREEMKEEITELRDHLRRCSERMEDMDGKQKDMQFSQETVSNLLDEKAESQQRIRELEDDIIALTNRWKETEAELERMKERVKKMSTQLRDEENERNNLQMENGAVLAELRVTQKRLEASERKAEGLRQELSEMVAQQGHSHAELHQARLQAAQLTLQQSDADLALREGRARWAQEREAFKQAAELDKEKVQKLSRELQRKEEWLQEERMEREKLEVELGKEKDCSRVQLSDARRELQEAMAILRKNEKEREQLKLERQDLLDYSHLLEQRLEVAADNKWKEVALYYSTSGGDTSHPDSSSGDEKPSSEDERLASPVPHQTSGPPPWCDTQNSSSHRSVSCPHTET